MKKQLLLLLLTSCLLFSCNSESNSSTNDDDNSSSNILPTPIENEKKESITASEVFSILKKLGSATSYEIESGIKGINDYHEWLAKGYYYNTSMGYGYLLKEAYDKQYGDSIVYSFTLENDEVKLGGPYYSFPNGELTYINNLSSLYTFSTYESEYKNKIDSTSFITPTNGATYSENRYVIKLFAAALGLTSDDSLKSIKRISFFKKGSSFGFSFLGKIGENYSKLIGSETLISNINAANHPVLNKYLVNNYLLGKTMLTSDVLSNFDLDENEKIKLHNEANVYIDGVNEGANIASELLLSKDKAEITSIDPLTLASTSNILLRHSDNYAYEQGYDEEGKVSEQLYEKYLDWDDLVPDLKSKLLEEKECYRLENNEYVYYGRLANRLKDFFGQMDIKGSPDRMFLTLDNNGLVNGVRFEYPLSKYTNNGTSFIYRYILNCDLVTADEFTVLNDLDDSLKINELDTAFAAFNGDSSFQVLFKDSLATDVHEIITYTDGVYYDQEITTTFGGKKITANGYYQKNNGVQSFIMSEDGSYYARSSLKNGDIASYIPHHISSALFLKNSDNTYVLRDHTLSYISKGLPFNYNASLMLPESAKFVLDENNLLKTVSFTYNWDIINVRTEEVTFEYENISLPDNAKNALTSLGDFVEPTSWSDESSDIANNFISLYGDDADKIPYLYVEETYKQWQSDYSISEQVQLTNKTTSNIDSKFYEAYRQALISNGFVLAINPSLPGAEEYNLGKIKVRLAKVLKGGLYFTLNS